jgi:hypothetical protein
LKSNIKEIKEPSGWQGNIYYPDGSGGKGFGIEVLPNGQVWFPCIDLTKEITQPSFQEQGSHTPNSGSINKVVTIPEGTESRSTHPVKRQTGDN